MEKNRVHESVVGVQKECQRNMIRVSKEYNESVRVYQNVRGI